MTTTRFGNVVRFKDCICIFSMDHGTYKRERSDVAIVPYPRINLQSTEISALNLETAMQHIILFKAFPASLANLLITRLKRSRFI